MNTIPTSIGNVTPRQIIDELTYASFASNRDEGMTAEAYGRLLRMDTAAYESRYQQENSHVS